MQILCDQFRLLCDSLKFIDLQLINTPKILIMSMKIFDLFKQFQKPINDLISSYKFFSAKKQIMI